MRSLWLLTKKDLKLLIRAKGSALIIVLAPLLLILILGLSYNTTQQYGLTIGVHAASDSEDVKAFVDLLKEKEYTITSYELIDDCLTDIKRGITHTCIDLPASLKVEGNAPAEVKFYIDPSKINLVWVVQDAVQKKFDFKSQQISQEISTSILSKLSDTKGKTTTERDRVGTVKEKNNNAASSTTAAKSSLTGVDTTPPPATFDPSTNNISGMIDLSKEKIKEAKKVVDSANLSGSDKNKINTALGGASSQLDVVSTAVGSSIGALEADLAAAKGKLANAASAISASTSGLDTASTSLQESIAALEQVQNTLNTVVATLESQKITNPNTVAAPIVTKIESVGDQGTYLHYLFPLLLVLVVMFSSLLLGTTLVMMEKNSPAFLRNFFLPINKAMFIISTYLTTLILIVTEVIIILTISLFFLSQAAAQIPLVAIILLLTASVFAFIGMGIGYLFTSEETGVLASISVGTIFLFLSGAILPLEGLSQLLRTMSYFNPFVIAESLIREVFLFKAPFAQITGDFLLLLAYAIILFLLIWLAESIAHKHLIHRFMKKHHKIHHTHKDG